MNHLDPLWLQSFVAIAETGSITRAARQVHRTPSAISMQLRQLESSLGAELVQRTTRSLQLLPAGERLLPYARSLLDLQAQARRALQAPHRDEAPWRLGFSEYFVSHRLRALLDLLKEQVQGARLEILWAPSAQLQDLWQSGQADLVVLTANTPIDGGRLIRREPISWVAAKGWASQGPAPLVLLGPECPIRQRALDALDRGRRDYELRLSCSGSQAAVSAIRSGWGVGCLNASAVPPDLQVLKQGWPSVGHIDFWGAASARADGLLRELPSWSR